MTSTTDYKPQYMGPKAQAAVAILFSELLRSGWTCVAVDDGGDVPVPASDVTPLETIDSVEESTIYFVNPVGRRHWVLWISQNGFDAPSDHSLDRTNEPDTGFAAAMDRVYEAIELRQHYGADPLEHPEFVRALAIAEREAKASNCVMVVGWQTNDVTGYLEPGYCPKLVAGPAFVHTILREVAP